MKNLRMRLAIARQPLNLWLYAHITYFLAVKFKKEKQQRSQVKAEVGSTFFVSAQKCFELAVLEE